MTDPRGYVICCTPRSGSNFLCSLLDQTGVLGYPTEYFNTDARTKQFGTYPSDPVKQVKKIIELGSTPNGVYGLKIMPFQADDAVTSRWASVLPDLRWVFLERTDVVAQAVSWVKAYQTGQWRSKAVEARAAPIYDQNKIAIELANIIAGNARWNLFFALNDIEPIRLNYETITANPKPAIKNIAEILDVEIPTDFDYQSRERVQRDAINDEWATRFKLRAANMDRLPRFS